MEEREHTLKVAFLAIGDELLNGRQAEKNGALLARALWGIGVPIVQFRVVRDEHDAIVGALEALSHEHDVVVTSGGLGLTRDDLTREALAKWLSSPLMIHEPSISIIAGRVAQRGREWASDLRLNAQIPRDAEPIANGVGLAVGFIARGAKATVAVLPGVPTEFAAMVREGVVPWVEAHIGVGHARGSQQRTIIFGLGEREIERRVGALDLPAGVRFGICAQDGPVEITLSGDGGQWRDASNAIAKALGDAVIGYDATIPQLVLNECRMLGVRLALAESCTGGLIASMLTDVPGASDVLLEGAVTYSNEAKRERLGVGAETLERFGAVSQAVVLEMAEGIRRTARADWGVAVSGIAGPGGGSDDCPVGCVHLAVAGPVGCWYAEERFFGLSRRRIKRRAALAAQVLLLQALRGERPPR